MRYVWTIIVSFLLIQMIFYVLGSMNAAEYSFGTASIVSLIVSVFVFLIGDQLIPSSEENR